MEACFRMFVRLNADQSVEVPFDRSAFLSRFRQPVAQVLAGRVANAAPAWGSAGPPVGQGGCFDMSLDEARSLADLFLSPVGGGAHQYWGIVIRFGHRPDPARPGATRREVAYVNFEELLPEGAPSAYFGG
jgi:hypothetical protein